MSAPQFYLVADDHAFALDGDDFYGAPVILTALWTGIVLTTLILMKKMWTMLLTCAII